MILSKKWSNHFVKILDQLYIKDWRAYIAEFLATFIFVLISCGVVLADLYFVEIGKVGIALASGFSYASLIYITSHLSGGYLNPAITLALWFSQKLTSVKAVNLIFAQILASFAAAGTLYYIFGPESRQLVLGAPILGIETNIQVATVVEALASAILVFGVFGTMVDRGGPVSFGPWVLGMLLVAMTLFAQPLTGAALNPARAIGPSVISENYNSLIVYLVGPAAGSLFGLVYDFLFLKKSKK